MASLIPGYEYDIFISYRQKDNKYDGWVTEFVDNLKRELEATFKDEVSVYFDINPHDGLLETHDVDASLVEKLKCLVFIPIISRTYCDPRSFAWEHEFKAFVEQTSKDQFGLKVKLPNGNVASRVLPVRIHDLDNTDIKLCESIIGGVLRGVEFIYKSPGVNRPLRSREDNPHDNLNHTIYRDQINKIALAIKDIIESMKIPVASEQVRDRRIQIKESAEEKVIIPEELVRKEKTIQEPKAQIIKIKPARTKKFYRSISIIPIVIIILILGFISIRLFYNQKKRQYAYNELIPQIQKLVEDNFTPPFKAFELATEAEKYISDDSSLIKLWPRISENVSLQTKPEGAGIFWKDYNQPADLWKEAGVTPLKNIKFPLGYKRIKIEKEGFQTVFITRFNLLDLTQPLMLDSIGVLPPDMVRIPSHNTPLYIVGIERYGGKLVGEFLADRFEVTNKQYKKFVDAGGYEDKTYWHYTIYLEEKEIPWESIMNLFVDKTGKHGPAGWEVGTYPDGQEDFPVAGISWYEASAYASFVGKRLPNVYQWSVIAETSRSMNIIPLSNFSGKSTVHVGNMEGMSSYGIYDLAGNVREWCYNGDGVYGESYILGGGWNDPSYSFNDAGIQPSIDRSLSNGFRCILELPGDTTISYLSNPIPLEFRDYHKEKPVDDKTFNIFLRQFAYDKSPLNEEVITEADTGTWRIEKVIMDAGYNNEKLIVYLYLPRDVHPPYQPVIYFPGSNAIHMDMIASNYVQRLDFIVKSGRVLVYPVLQGTFGRKDGLKSDLPDETVFYKDHVIMWRKDIGRTIDYLETRPDILVDKIGYFGWSWGGYMGGIIPAIEKRIKAIVLHVGGMAMQRALPEGDQINFLPRVYQPVLMLNGKYDMYFPVETSQMPMFNLLGTPAKDKKIIIYDTGHLVPRTELIKETLAWYDKYLGPVK
jgi:dienelactone hydrolase